MIVTMKELTAEDEKYMRHDDLNRCYADVEGRKQCADCYVLEEGSTSSLAWFFYKYLHVKLLTDKCKFIYI